MKIRIHNPIYGVPITYLGCHCPEQFEIIGITVRWSPLKIKEYTNLDDKNFRDLNANPCIKTTNGLETKYARLIIKRK